MYLICRGEDEVLDERGNIRAVMREGDFFGELALLLSEPRTATVRAKTHCDLFVLERSDFSRILREHQQFADAITQTALDRYHKTVTTEALCRREPKVS